MRWIQLFYIANAFGFTHEMASTFLYRECLWLCARDGFDLFVRILKVKLKGAEPLLLQRPTLTYFPTFLIVACR